MAVRRQENTTGVDRGVTLYAPPLEKQWIPPYTEEEWKEINKRMQEAFDEYMFNYAEKKYGTTTIQSGSTDSRSDEG